MGITFHAKVLRAKLLREKLFILIWWATKTRYPPYN